MSLQDLPPELTESIVVLLSLSDTSSLRLTSRCLASKTAQEHLKARFRTKRVEITEQRLRSFVAVTSVGGLGCLLQDLTLVAPVYNTSELATRLRERGTRVARLDEDGPFVRIGFDPFKRGDIRRTRLDLAVLKERLAEQNHLVSNQKDAELLGQALANLAAHGGSLRRLRTEVEVYKDDTVTPLLPLFGGNWKPIWTAAANVSRTLFASLAACNLPVQSLDLFNNTRMLRCSLYCDELNSVDFASGRLGQSLSQLTELSLSISEGTVEQSSQNDVLEESNRQSGHDGLRSLLQTCPSVQTLDLGHFSLDRIEDSTVHFGRIIRALGESSLPCLKNLTLQGFKVTESELLTSLQGLETLRSLSLRYIQLIRGSFKRILDYCTIKAAMEKLELESLFEHRVVGSLHEPRVIQFESPWMVRPQKTPPERFPALRASYRRASDDEVGHQIKHHIHQAPIVVAVTYHNRDRRRPGDSPSIREWKQDLKNRFGPLPANGKPSCLQPHVPPEQLWRYG